MNGFEDVVSWFGNAEWGLGLPMPWLMALLATSTEVIGAVMLLFGFGVRWQAVADAKSPWPPEGIEEAQQRLEAARSILQEHGNYDWLTGSGSFVISNNGIEWAATYFIMLLALFFIGAGKYFSADYWIKRQLRS